MMDVVLMENVVMRQIHLGAGFISGGVAHLTFVVTLVMLFSNCALATALCWFFYIYMFFFAMKI